MASDLAPLPTKLLNLVTSFTGNITSGKNYVKNLSSVAGLEVGQIVVGAGIPAGTTITFINSNPAGANGLNVQISAAATATTTALACQAYVDSYSTDQVYAAVPQVLQDADATASINPNLIYPLYAFIYSMASFVDKKINSLIRDGIGATGYSDPTYVGAPGWSQLVDIDRCPDFALPWLGQLVGVNIPAGLSRADMVTRIKERSGFQRGTVSSLVSAILRIVNNNRTGTLLTADKIKVIEQTNYVGSAYTHDDYSVVILVPSTYFPSYSYTSLNAAAGAAALPPTSNPNYTQLDSFIGVYSNINANLTPSSSSAFSSYIESYRPAGVRVLIGGY